LVFNGKFWNIGFFISEGNYYGHALVVFFERSSLGAANAECVLIVLFIVSKWSWCSSFLLLVLLTQSVCWSSCSWLAIDHDAHPFFSWSSYYKSRVDHPN
jgi:hypothetical protein